MTSVHHIHVTHPVVPIADRCFGYPVIHEPQDHAGEHSGKHWAPSDYNRVSNVVGYARFAATSSLGMP